MKTMEKAAMQTEAFIFKFLVIRNSYSLARATIGSSFAAFLAGRYPNITPIIVEHTTAATMENTENTMDME